MQTESSSVVPTLTLLEGLQQQSITGNSIDIETLRLAVSRANRLLCGCILSADFKKLGLLASASFQLSDFYFSREHNANCALREWMRALAETANIAKILYEASPYKK